MKMTDLLTAIGIVVLLIFCIWIMIVVPKGSSYQEVSESNLQEDYCNGYFTVETEWRDGSGNYRIVYANDTGVKYFCATSGHKYAITPLYNADGSLQVHEE